jgi:hypothetical protein
MKSRKWIVPALGTIIPILVILLIITNSMWQPQGTSDRSRAFTRKYEFDYFYWTLNSLWEKAAQASLGIEGDLNTFQDRSIVNDLLNTVKSIKDVDNHLKQIYSNPDILDPAVEAQPLLQQKIELETTFQQQRLIAESILQAQISAILVRKNLDFLQAPFPPVLFKLSSLPDQLIVSPRSVIREDASISLNPGLTDQQKDELEREISSGLNVSALVVPLGGIGVYPTMVYREASLEYLIKVIAHEWIHNFLVFRPLGWNYDTSPQLRTMNETTADICATEISQAVLRSFYAENLSPGANRDVFAVSNVQQITFDFNKEMHATRVAVEDMLAQGKIEDAENIMEAKRKVFWENGYQIRKLNQAYFAFYGAYAEQPIGAAGNDPVGPAVRSLRTRSGSLAEFLNRIAMMTSFEQLQKALIPQVKS